MVSSSKDGEELHNFHTVFLFNLTSVLRRNGQNHGFDLREDLRCTVVQFCLSKEGITDGRVHTPTALLHAFFSAIETISDQSEQTMENPQNTGQLAYT
jgi:hypothetical protein